MKQSVTKFDLDAAFKALDDIGYETPKGGIKANRVNLKEAFTKKLKTDLLIEDYYDVNDGNDLEDAKDVREDEIAKAKLARIEKIVDLDASSPDDLLPSYVGKYIIRCPQCMTLFYKDKNDIEESEDDNTVVNVGETCQHCGNTSGYDLIGKVGQVEQDELNNYNTAKLENNGEAEEAQAEENTENEEAQEEQPAEENTEKNEEENNEAGLDEFNLNLDTEEEKKEESLNLSKAQKEAEKNSELATENKSENRTLNEANKFGRPDEDDYYAQDVNDAVMELKKKGKAEFWCRVDGKKKAEEVIKTFKDRYGKDAEYTIEDDYCTAKVVESLTEGKAWKNDLEFCQMINDGKVQPNPYALGYIKLGELSQLCVDNHLDYAHNVIEKAIDKVAEPVTDRDDSSTNTAKYEENDLTVESKKESIKESLDTDLLNELVDKIPMDIRTDLNVETNPLYGEGQGVIGDILFDFDFNEDTIAKATELANAVISNLDQAKYSYQIWNPNALSTEECQSIDEVVRAATEQNEVDLFDEDGYLQISIYENESAVGESLNKSEAQKDAEKNSDLATKNKSENKTLNEDEAPKTLGDVTFTEADVKKLEKTELSKDISDAEVEALLDNGEQVEEDLEFETDIEDIDENEVENLITESLTKVYSNIRTFKLKECTVEENNRLVFEGLITFHSAKSKRINYVFTEAKKTKDNKVILTGINEALGANSKFVLTGLLENKNLKPQTFSYNYVVNSKLVEGLIQR